MQACLYVAYGNERWQNLKGLESHRARTLGIRSDQHAQLS